MAARSDPGHVEERGVGPGSYVEDGQLGATPRVLHLPDRGGARQVAVPGDPRCLVALGGTSEA
eukprot:CAMPEP_0113840644 /NCGR_PEP_ID=MMETSP0328-20130328/11728_1 /TAXON_ID=39455 /ORGANISM="Alexandrium minutum" /LENGTH=62 /DNA_ID=CAMNT_0000809349 /DNA_START=5 /DNA_END=190 /DNA_ORIENTATION=+ /assembly_acc=CAM_ASM_000350